MDGMEGLSDPAASAQPQQAAPAPVQAAPQAQPPHAGLSAYISKLALGIDAFATSAATQGREGGVEEVQRVNQRDAEMKLKQQAAQDAAKESDVRIKHTQALTNASIAQTQMLLHDAPLDYQDKVLQHNKNLADFLTNTMHIPSAFVVPMLEGQGTDEHMAAINGKASGDLVNNTAIPVHDSKFAGSGKSVGFSFDQLKKTNLTGEQMGPTLASLQGQVDLAKGYLGADDPAVKVAQGKLDLFKGADTVNGWDFYNFNQQTQAQLMSKVSNKEAITKFNTEQAALTEKNQKNDPLFKLENDPAEMSGDKAPAAVALLTAKAADPKTSPAEIPRVQRLLVQAKMAQQNALAFDAAKQKTAQAVKEGDPVAAGKLLASGMVAPSEIISTRNPRFAQQAFDAAKAANPAWSAQKAEAQYKYATNPQTQGTLNMIDSMTGPDNKSGTLAILQSQAKDLKNGDTQLFNKVGNEISLQSGHPEMAAFNATLLGVVDEYAKVLGGGQATDSSRKEAAALFPDKFSPAQATAAVDSIRKTMANRKEAMIRDNPALNAMYTGGSGTAANPKAPASNERAVYGADGKTVIGYTSDGKTMRPAGQ